MFLRGADPMQSEIRPASIKGALRFWWRALNWQKYPDLTNLHKAEADIFGFAEIGRSKVGIAVKDIKYPEHSKNGLPPFEGFGNQIGYQINSSRGRFNVLDYLAYGVTKDRKSPTKFIPTKTSFNIDLRFSKKLSEEQKESVLDALSALSHYANLGAKSRNGFGKVWIASLADRKENVDRPLFSGGLAPYTAGSENARLLSMPNPVGQWHEALALLGKKYYESRLAIEANQSSGGLHDTRKRYLLAQPLNEKNSKMDKIDENGRKETVYFKGDFELQRHSKSIFFSIVPDGKQVVGQVLHLPYHYLRNIQHSKAKAKVKYKTRDKKSAAEYQADYLGTYQAFLNKFIEGGELTDITPNLQTTETETHA